MAERRLLPVTVADDDRNDDRLTGVLASQRASDLRLVMIGTEVVGADEQDHEIGLAQVALDLSGGLLPGEDALLMPDREFALLALDPQSLLQPRAMEVVLRTRA